MGCPCVSVMGLVAGLVASERVIVDGVKFDFQPFTRLATLTDPSPVARSKPEMVVNAARDGLPDTRMPYWPEAELVLLQFGEPPAQMTELFPVVTS